MQEFLDATSHMFERFSTALTVLVCAIIGRLMYHADQVKRGKRAFWSIALAMDMIIAVGMGLITWGACVWGNLTGPPQAAIIAVAGYLGPALIDVIYADKFNPKPSDTEGQS